MTMREVNGSDFDKLFYPYLFAGGKANFEDVLVQVQHSTVEKCHEIVALRREVFERFEEQIIAAGRAMAQAFAHSATLLAFGNGGSATDAQDFVAELLHPSQDYYPSFPAISLTNDSAVLTAVGNDVGFHNVFARQMIAYGRPGDIAVGFSTSGASANILQAFEQAKKQGLFTIGLAGYDGGKMVQSDNIDICIVAPGDHIPRIQEAHATIYHTLIDIVYAILRDE